MSEATIETVVDERVAAAMAVIEPAADNAVCAFGEVRVKLANALASRLINLSNRLMREAQAELAVPFEDDND